MCGSYEEDLSSLSDIRFGISGVLTLVTVVAGAVGNILSIITLLNRYEWDIGMGEKEYGRGGSASNGIKHGKCFYQ